ncbi:MAG: SAM-dependent methyltransferase, partial [Miltoncostaeaceae bacterium]
DEPVAVATQDVNAQHYALPPAFFELVLGPHLKYSCCYWPAGVDDLGAAEEAMLLRYAERARLENGQDVLDLGCGWGSLSLWLAARHPDSRILGVTGSSSQAEFIRRAARDRDLDNVEVTVCDANVLTLDRSFDRIVSIEMLEHVKNLRLLLGRAAGWLRPDGLAFVHVFSHRDVAFEYHADNTSDWIGRHFFSGGTMPSDALIPRAAADSFDLVDHWRLGGEHYARTARAWLDNLDEHRDAAAAALAEGDNPEPIERQIGRWRLFFLVCEGTWGHAGGGEFMVSHYLMRPRAPGTGG